MKNLKIVNAFILLLFSSTVLKAQIQALYNTQTQAKSLTERWELDTTSSRGTFLITPYKPIYGLPMRWSSHPNEKPISANPDPNYVPRTALDYNNIEAKFQLSFKTKILQSIFWGHGDLWLAYTQISHWQLYNNKLSRPFREINYEPEVILNFPVNFKILGFKAKMIGLAFNHNSNGKSNPLSRSWNRIIFHAGFEHKNWTVYVRPWLRLKDEIDDNPDISELVGRGDLNIIYNKNGNVFSLITGNNLNFGSKLRVNTELSWSFPIKANLKGFLQIAHGYGETLIDYNNKQTTVGIGVSLIEWL